MSAKTILTKSTAIVIVLSLSISYAPLEKYVLVIE